MLLSLQSYVRRSRNLFRRWALDPRFHSIAQAVLYLLSGFCFSAASLENYCLPLSLSLVCACSGWSSVLAAAGGMLGYWVFWGQAGQIGIFWLLAALPCAMLLSDSFLSRQTPLLMPAVSSLIAAAGGVVFQIVFYDTAPILIYLLRIALSGAAALLFQKLQEGRNAILDWLGAALLVLALAQLVPIPYLGLGYLAAGFLAGAGTFPAAVLAGLALELAHITPVPMTAVLALAYLIRFLPHHPKWLAAIAPTVVCVWMMNICGTWDFHTLPGLLLGSIAGTWLPLERKFQHRRGETGVAQVRLELASSVLSQTEALLLEVEAVPVDEEALMVRAADRACSGCAYRKSCRDTNRIRQLPATTLHKPLLSTDELPIVCRKPGRFLAELHRCQEQLRSIQADRQRQNEYRAAVIQQYRFLSSYLQDLADQLPRRTEQTGKLLSPEISVYSNRLERDNGDRCMRFAGVGKKYYVLLCDGMGTGLGAVQEGKTGISLLHRMLSAGYPAEHALRSLNSLCALRNRAGALTVDLAEIMLDTGKVTLYKWGAAPSYITTKYGAEQLGTASPPPGISVTDEQERVERTSLRRGEWLVMVSDGIGQREALRCCMEIGDRSPGELAAALLSYTPIGSQDDATVVITRLRG